LSLIKSETAIYNIAGQKVIHTEGSQTINVSSTPAAQSLLTLSNTKNKSYDRNVVAFFVEKSSVYYI